MIRCAHLITISALVLTGACSSSGTGSTGTGGSGAGTGAGGSAGLSGSITVTFTSAIPADDAGNSGTAANATISAAIYDSAFPPTLKSGAASRVSESMSGCDLLVPSNATCDAGCPASPTLDGVGALHVHGLKASDGGTDIEIDPTGSMQNFYSGPTLLDPFPPCAEGSTVSVDAAGAGTISAFSISGAKCIAPLVLTGPDPIPLVNAQKTPIGGALSWTPPAQGGNSKIQVLLEVSHHSGTQYGQINCTVSDTGSFTIPQKLIADLIALGTGGYPTITISRVSTATSTAHPGVQLVITSGTDRSVDTGVVSCGANGDNTCPSGKTCQSPPYLCL